MIWWGILIGAGSVLLLETIIVSIFGWTLGKEIHKDIEI